MAIAQRHRAPLHRRDGVFVVTVKDLLLELEPRSAYELLPRLVWLSLLEQLGYDLLADPVAGCVLYAMLFLSLYH